MTKHSKIAIFIAPFLLLAGFITADWYQSKIQAQQIYPLTLNEPCDIRRQHCVLSNGKHQVALYPQQKQLVLNTTFPMQQAFLIRVDDDKNQQTIPLSKLDSPFYFYHDDASLITHQPNQQLRLVIRSELGQFIAEFYSQNSE
jgi:hypothetical protein